MTRTATYSSPDRDKIVYIAGPMTGLVKYNHPAFMRARDRWLANGFSPVTPFDSNNTIWRRHFARDFNPSEDVCDWGDPILDEILAENWLLVSRSATVALLPGWQNSKGSKAELLVAINSGKRIVDAEEGIPLAMAYNLEFINMDESVLAIADEIVSGSRQSAYGHPLDDYTRTGRMWGAILGIPDIPAWKCCLMMDAMKTSRECNKHKQDNLIDKAGYTKCAQLCIDEEARRALQETPTLELKRA
jgi:hypothetical protein